MRFPLSSDVAALNSFPLWLSNTGHIPWGEVLETRESMHLPIKRLTACRTFAVLAVSGALPLYQNLRSDSPTKSAHSTTIRTWDECQSCQLSHVQGGWKKKKTLCCNLSEQRGWQADIISPGVWALCCGWRIRGSGGGWWSASGV